jgi:hypothetical protein
MDKKDGWRSKVTGGVRKHRKSELGPPSGASTPRPLPLGRLDNGTKLTPSGSAEKCTNASFLDKVSNLFNPPSSKVTRYAEPSVNDSDGPDTSVLNFWLLVVICARSLVIVSSENSGRSAIIHSRGFVARY